MRGHGVLQVVLAAGAFACVSAAVRCAVPLPSSYGLRAKIEHLASQPDAYDTIFVGSSLVFRGIDPEVIDREFALRGREVRSFNLGVPGLDAFELEYLLRRLVEMDVRADRLFVEHIPRRVTNPTGRRTLDDRTVYWHDLATTWSALRTIADSRESRARKLVLAIDQVRLMARLYTNHATAASVLARFLGRDDTFDYLTRSDLIDRRGYQDPDSLQDERTRLRRRAYLEGVEEYKALVAATRAAVDRWRRDHDRGAALWDTDVRGVRALVEHVSAPGREVIAFLPPMLGKIGEAYALNELGAYPELISVCDPDEYAVLYARDHHFDVAHLNARGAAACSAAVVRSYCEARDAAADRPTVPSPSGR